MGGGRQPRGCGVRPSAGLASAPHHETPTAIIALSNCCITARCGLSSVVPTLRQFLAELHQSSLVDIAICHDPQACGLRLHCKPQPS